jgi:hypothetical protein
MARSRYAPQFEIPADRWKPLKQHVPVSIEDAPVNQAVWTTLDRSTTIYPKLPNGQSCRVVIIRREMTKAAPGKPGTTFHVCRNAGKWSYRIDYRFKEKTTRVTRSKFVEELKRMGARPNEIFQFLES